MSTLLNFLAPSETKRAEEYYGDYNLLLKTLDAAGNAHLGKPMYSPRDIDMMNDVAIEVTGLIDYQINNLGAKKSVSIDIIEILFEMLDGDLDDGELITRSIYVAYTEIQNLLQHYKKEGKSYSDTWHIDRQGRVLVKLAKVASGSELPNTLDMSQETICALQKRIYSHLMPVLEDQIDFKSFTLEQQSDEIDVTPLLKGFRDQFSTEITDSHGAALITYLRTLQIILFEQKQILESKDSVRLQVQWKIVTDWNSHQNISILLDIIQDKNTQVSQASLS